MGQSERRQALQRARKRARLREHSLQLRNSTGLGGTKLVPRVIRPRQPSAATVGTLLCFACTSPSITATPVTNAVIPIFCPRLGGGFSSGTRMPPAHLYSSPSPSSPSSLLLIPQHTTNTQPARIPDSLITLVLPYCYTLDTPTHQLLHSPPSRCRPTYRPVFPGRPSPSGRPYIVAASLPRLLLPRNPVYDAHPACLPLSSSTLTPSSL